MKKFITITYIILDIFHFTHLALVDVARSCIRMFKNEILILLIMLRNVFSMSIGKARGFRCLQSISPFVIRGRGHVNYRHRDNVPFVNSDMSKVRLFSTINENDRDVSVDGNWSDQGEEDSSDSDEEFIDEIEEDRGSSLLYQQLSASVQKTLETLLSKQSALQRELEKAKSLEDTMYRANLIISNLWQLPAGTEKATVQDWENDGKEVEIILDSQKYSDFKEESDALFSAARKMKRGSAIVSDLLSEVKEAIQILQDSVLDLEATKNEDDDILQGRIELVLGRLERTASKTGFVMQSTKTGQQRKTRNPKSFTSTRAQPTFRKFLSPNGCIVLVGRNRRDNEAICFQVAKGDDIWFHARGCPGAHVLLQVRRGSPRPTEECIQFAANLAAFYSDARTERKADVTQAAPKHIQKPRGAPLGAVKLREELGTVIGYPADVDEELKIAREKSGVIWDEAGSRSHGGKAKNRKKTKENTKQMISKIRSEKRSKRKRGNALDETSEFY
jgi:predicted ribosome quality control (RQC) complex YloA/Tae2 family protein